ncbi:zinc finger and SCAN domain-containing protein 29-like [Gopherus flavomarginatus]|uniref:zinc finger and SCAN domain-containing protein 29-like n=1 Tax=Gopherus flavomarginatus TaxID=286002 RepID=UPI0021CC100C|nr:zinc finger and SCAN domain-containing protein 29-like [Gopherus flavomarginatus]
MRRGHERDALQCRVKIKELRSAYCKAREGNRRSGAAPKTCRFYQELDAILGCDPTANPRTTMENSQQGEVGEGVEEGNSEATGVEGDTPESQEACSQELFSSQEEASQSQQQEVAGEEETEERARVTLTNAASWKRGVLTRDLKDNEVALWMFREKAPVTLSQRRLSN